MNVKMGGYKKAQGNKMKKKQKMTLVLRLYPEDAIQVLMNLYREQKLTESQYLKKTDKAVALLK